MAVVFQSKRARLFWRGTEGDKFLAVPGIASFALSGGEAPTSEVVDFESATTLTGFPRPASIECSVTKYVPYHSVWRQINAAALAGDEGQFELRFRGVTLFTPAAADPAQVTLAGGNLTWTEEDQGQKAPSLTLIDVGMLLLIGDDAFRIEETGEALTDINVKALADPAVGVFTQAHAIGNVGLQVPNLAFGPFPTAIANSDLPSAESEGGMSSTLSLRPNSKNIDWSPKIIDPAVNFLKVQ